MTATDAATDQPWVGRSGTWHIVAIAALGTTAGLIYVTGSIDTCSPVGQALLFAGWQVTPVIALAALAAAATVTRNRIERWAAYIFTAALTLAWLAALAGVSIGPMLNQTGC